MSKTVPVEFGDRFFWAFDVSLGILLLEAIRLDAEMPPEQRPARVDVVLDDFQGQIEIGATMAFSLDDRRWNQPERAYAHRLINEAGRLLRTRGVISREEATRRYVVNGEPYHLRHADQIDGAVIADLAEAIGRLIRDELPPPSEPGRHWFFGVPDGPRTL